jgi:hypothetical protein
VRRPGNEPAADSLPSCSEVDSSMPPCSRPNGDDLIPELLDPPSVGTPGASTP